MDDLKKRWERAIAEAFFSWFNSEQKSTYVFHEVGANPPDVIYKNGAHKLPVEITSAFNSNSQAAALGKWARGSSAPSGFDAFNPDTTLIENLNRTIANKCLASADPTSFLVVSMYPDFTPITDFEIARVGIQIPSKVPYKGVFIGGNFPSAIGSTPGYRWWRIA